MTPRRATRGEIAPACEVCGAINAPDNAVWNVTDHGKPTSMWLCEKDRWMLIEISIQRGR